MRLIWIAFAALILGAVQGANAEIDVTFLDYQEKKCTVAGITKQARCYTLVRPIEGGKTFTLGGVIVPSDAASPDGDPLVVISGGPGQAASDSAAQLSEIFAPVLRSRDVIFFDIRGAGKSGGDTCKGIGEENREPPLTRIDLGTVRKLLVECRAAFEGALDTANTEVAAADLEALRLAMGTPQFNLWGVSYGTRLAQYYMMTYPGSVRRAVLDSVVPFAPSYQATVGEYADQALAGIVADCANSAQCAAAFPNFDPFQLLAEIGDERSIEYAHPVTGKVVQTVTDRDTVAQVVFSALYSIPTRAMIPYVLTQAVQNDNWAPLAVLGDDPGYYFGIESIYPGARFSVFCAEEDLDSLDPKPSRLLNMQAAATLMRATCEAWPAKPLTLPVPSDGSITIPTLMISGGRDPVTPPALAAHAEKYFSNHQHLVLDAAGHSNIGVLCVQDYVNGFITSESLPSELPACEGQPYIPDFETGPNANRGVSS